MGCYDLAMRSFLMISLSLMTFAALAQTPVQVTVAPPPPPPPSTPVTGPDPVADEIARRSIDILGGPAWEKARYVSFTFNLDRGGQPAASFQQRWDRTTGLYRVSGKDPNGVPFVIVENVNTKSGRAWQNGVEVLEPAALQELLAVGYRRFVNDTYWLLMPLKMLDANVRRSSLGERSDACGRKWDVLRLIFDQGAGVPTDTYWAWINHETGIVEEWDMKLQGTPADQPAVEVFFHDFHRVGGLLISTKREVKGKNQTVRLDDLIVLSDVPKGAFDVK
jgi:hypothetical protein